ncbi:MAG: hypothetical protein WC376_00410 [Candidatus Nanoarchaeia archaeon]|jgi:hypothetical protein
MKILIATGKNGKLDNLGVNTLEAYLTKEQKIKNREEKGDNPFTPIYEADMKFEPIMIKAGKNEYKEAVEKVYNELIDSGKYIPGVYGDFFKFAETTEGIYLIGLGNKAYNKPNHASDLGMLIFSNDKEQQIFVPLVRRKNEPGKGKAAIPGGFWNKGEGYIDSGLYTILKEAKEEFNLTCMDDIEKYRNDYNTKEVELAIQLAGKDYKGLLKHAGTFKTSDALIKEGGERISEKSQKIRVDMTDFYILAVHTDMNSKELEKALRQEYKVNDKGELSKVMIENITPYVLNNDAKGLNEKLQCGIQHHKTLIEKLVETAQ